MNQNSLNCTTVRPPLSSVTSGRRLRLIIVQPVVPAYNIPIFEAIAQFENIDMTVWADLETPSQLNQYDSGKHHFRAEHLRSKRFGAFILRPGLLWRLLVKRPDIVILNGNPRDLSDAVALLLCRLMGCGVAVWNMFHRIGGRRWWTELYLRYVGRLSHLVLCYGKKGQDEQLGRGTSAHKVLVMSTAIDERKIIQVRDSISEDEVTAFRSEHGLTGKHVLLHVVRLTEIKRPDLMVKYYACLLESRQDTVLVWIGGGPLESETKRRAEELGLLGYMRFLGPIYDERKLALWYLSGSLFVMATCVGLSIHHAMCYGLPVITDDNESTQASEFEVLQDGVNGVTFSSGDANDFVLKVNRLLDNSELRDRLSAGAKSRLENEYTLAHKIERVRTAVAILRSQSRVYTSENLRVRRSV